MVIILIVVFILPTGSTSGSYEVTNDIPEYILEDHLNLTGISVDPTIWGRGQTTKTEFDKGTLTNVTTKITGNGAVGLEPELDFQVLNGGNAILMPGSGTAWDSIIIDCDVVRDGNHWYMYYTGSKDVGTDYPDHIGLATSSDGISWTKYSGNPILSANVDSYDYDYLTTPQVIKDGSIWRMYYGGVTHDSVTNYIDVCYAYSSDGVNWTKYSSNPVLYHGTPTSKWDGRLAQPTCLAKAANGSLLLYYRGKGTSGISYLGLATTTDGVNWSKHGSNPLRSASTTGWEDGWSLGYSLEQANGTYRLWTTGDVDNHKIGYCTSEDLLNWTDSGSAVLTPKASTGYSKGVTGPKVIDMGDHYWMYLRGDDDNDVFRFFVFNVTPKKLDGEFISDYIIHNRGMMKLRRFTWNAEVPRAGSIDISIRWGNQSDQWGEWVPVTNGSELHNVTAIYVWYRAKMHVDVDWIEVNLLDVMLGHNTIVMSVDISVDDGPWQPVNGSFDDWFLNVSLHDGDYDIVVRSNTSLRQSYLVTVPVKVDLYPPTGSILIEDGAFATNSTNVKIDVAANDTHTPIEMQLARNENFTGATWWPHIASETYGLVGDPEGFVTIYMRLRDAAGRISETYNDTILIDTTPPEGTLLINGGAKYTNSTAVDLTIDWTDRSGVISMMVSNDPDFQGAIWQDPVRALGWLIGETDGVHTVYVKLRDFVGWETVLTDDIILDRTPPAASLSIDRDAPYTTSRDVVLNITLYDQNPISYKLVNEGEPWPDSWRSTGSPLDLPWVLPTGPDGRRTVRMLVRDSAGNEFVTVDDILLDTTPPQGTLLINDGDPFTNALLVSCTLTADDATSGLDRMRISDSDDFTDVSWQTVKGSFTWSLPPGDGTRNVFVQLRDRAGQVATIDASIILDTTPPEGSVSILDVGEYSKSPEVDLSIDVKDNFGLDRMMVSSDPDFGDAEWLPFASVHQWDLGDEDGVVNVHVRARDLAGNVFETSVSTILDTTAPGLSAEAPDHTMSRSIDVSWSSTDAVGLDVLSMELLDGGGSPLLYTSTSLDGVRSAPDMTMTIELTEAMTPGSEELYVFTILLGSQDLAGWVTTVDLQVTYVPEAPVGTITIDDGDEWTNSTRVGVDLAHAGGLSPVRYRVALSEEGLASAEWVEWGEARDVELGVTPGERTVWAQLMGAFDITSEPFSDTIKLDTQAPVVDLVSPTTTSTEEDSVKLVLSASDDQDSWPTLEYRLNGGDWRQYTGEVRLSLEEGDNSVEVRSRDAAGNVGIAEASIRSDRGLSVGGASWLVLMVILVVVRLLRVWYWKNRGDGPEDR